MPAHANSDPEVTAAARAWLLTLSLLAPAGCCLAEDADCKPMFDAMNLLLINLLFKGYRSSHGDPGRKASIRSWLTGAHNSSRRRW